MPIILQADTKKKGGREVGGERTKNKFKGEERIKKLRENRQRSR